MGYIEILSNKEQAFGISSPNPCSGLNMAQEHFLRGFSIPALLMFGPDNSLSQGVVLCIVGVGRIHD